MESLKEFENISSYNFYGNLPLIIKHLTCKVCNQVY